MVVNPSAAMACAPKRKIPATIEMSLLIVDPRITEDPIVGQIGSWIGNEAKLVPPPCWLGSDSLVDEFGKEVGIDDELSPFRVVRCSGFRRDGLVERPSLFLEHCDVLTNADEHVAIGLQLGSVADWITVARNDDCRVGRRGQVGVGGPDHPVNLAARR